jgi:hypothetical protein
MHTWAKKDKIHIHQKTKAYVMDVSIACFFGLGNGDYVDVFDG